jgi:hypothetical protein
MSEYQSHDLVHLLHLRIYAHVATYGIGITIPVYLARTQQPPT